MESLARRRERHEIATLARGEHDGALLIVGPAGIGKTWLLEAARDEHDAVLVRVDETETSWPLSGISALLASVGDNRAAEFGGRFRLRSTEPDDLFVAAQDLLSMLRGLALPPTLLLVDDIDRLDPESRALVRAMAPRLAGTGLRLVATSRSLTPGQALVGLEIRRLGPLDDDAAFELLADAAGPSVHEGTLRILIPQCHGHPGELLDALHGLTGEQLRGREPLVLPLHRDPTVIPGDEAAPSSALMLASLAPRTPIALLQLVGIDRDAIDELLGHGLLESLGQTVWIADPARRSRVVWAMEHSDRQRRHRRLAQVARTAGIGWAETWHESFLTPDGAGPRLLCAAADRARELDVASATELAERALRLCQPGKDELPAILDLVAGLGRAGEPEMAARLLLHAPADDADPVTAMRIARLGASLQYIRAHRVPTDEIQGAIGLHGREAPDACAALLSIAAAYHADRGEAGFARALLRQAEPFLRGSRPQTAELHTAVRALTDGAEGMPTPVPDASPPADDHDDPDASTRRLIRGRALSLAEQYELARQTFSVVQQQLGSSDPQRTEAARYLAAENELRSGDVGRAREAVARWLEVAPHRPRRASRLFLEAWFAFANGNPEEAREFGERCLRRAVEEGDHPVIASLFGFQGGVALLAGDAEEAVRLLRAADLAASALSDPGSSRHAPDLVHALVRAGRRREAEATATALFRRRRERPSRWLTLACARVGALLAPDDRAAIEYGDAIALFGPEDSRFELAKVLLGRADAEGRTGRIREQAATIATARSTLEQAGAWAWETPEPVADPVGGGELDDLTAEEREVLRLVRLGYRNKEIARTLYVSLRTVELRMTHIFRKTGAASRAQLLTRGR